MEDGIPHLFEYAFKKKQAILIEKMDVSHGLLSSLLDRDVITKQQKEDCESDRSDYNRADKLLSILSRRPDHYFPLFVEALHETDQAHIMGLLNPDPGLTTSLQQQQQLSCNALGAGSQSTNANSYPMYSAKFSYNGKTQSTTGSGAAAAATSAIARNQYAATVGLQLPPNANTSQQYQQQQFHTAPISSIPGQRATSTSSQTSPPVTATQISGQTGTTAAADTALSPNTVQSAPLRTSSTSSTLITQFIPTDVNVIPYSELEIIGDPIHSGGFGLIHRAMHNKFGAVVFKELATKVINPKNGREMQKEVMAHTLRHANIVSTIGAVFEPEHYGVVLESAKHGALDTFIDTYEVEFLVKISFVRDIIRGLNYLHAMNPAVVHGYLKTQHVLVADGFVTKLCDFGLSKWQQFATTKTTSQTRRGTVTHIPPENWKDVNHKRTVKYDIYGLGILLWELFTEKMSFEQAANISDTVRLAVTEGQRPSLEDIDADEQMSEEMRSVVKRLISSCWAQEASERPSAGALKDEIEKLTTGQDEQMQKAKDKLDTEIMNKNASTLTIQQQQPQ